MFTEPLSPVALLVPPAWIRTRDLSLTGGMLCLLSYGGERNAGRRSQADAIQGLGRLALRSYPASCISTRAQITVEPLRGGYLVAVVGFDPTTNRV